MPLAKAIEDGTPVFMAKIPAVTHDKGELLAIRQYYGPKPTGLLKRLENNPPIITEEIPLHQFWRQHYPDCQILTAEAKHTNSYRDKDCYKLHITYVKNDKTQGNQP